MQNLSFHWQGCWNQMMSKSDKNSSQTVPRLKKKKTFFDWNMTLDNNLGVEGRCGDMKSAMPLQCEIQIMGKEMVMLNIY